MVQPEQPSIITRLQSLIDAQDERIQHLTTDVQALSTTVHSMQEMLKTFPDSMEKLISNLLTQHDKQHQNSNNDGSVHVLASGSGVKTSGFERFLRENHTEEQAVELFLRGLKGEISNLVRTLNPHTCDQAMEFAQHVSTATSSSSKRTKRNQTFTGSINQLASNGREYYPRSDSYVKPTFLNKPNPPTGPPFNKTQNNLNNSPTTHLTEHLTKAEWEVFAIETESKEVDPIDEGLLI